NAVDVAAVSRVVEKLEGPGHLMQELAHTPESWRAVTRQYGLACPGGLSFLDYFWIHRFINTPALNLLRTELPAARVYHSACMGKLVRFFEDWCAAIDSLNVCKNIAVCMEALPFEGIAEILRVTRGWDMSPEEVQGAGERIINIERAFCMREGISRVDDRPPKRFLEEPLPEECGPSAGMVFELEPMLDEYYGARGWDLQSGWPTRSLLEELGLDYVAAELEEMGVGIS
ncbi:MAG: aldehyde ferredoxin oxidoreductase C-terminal domain-containing protein, partial [Bacillota bacterium]